MKTHTKRLVAVLAGLLATPAAWAAGESWTGSLPLPDNNASGVAFPFVVNAPGQPITRVTVDLNIAGGWNGDLYAYLSHGTGFSVLLNRVGRTTANPFGFGDQGMQVQLADNYSADIHTSGGLAAGSLLEYYQPDGRFVNPSLALDTDPRTAMLSNFVGTNPNGQWTLFFADMAPGAQSTLRGWTVTIDSALVPEPGAVAMGGVVMLAAAGYVWRRQRTR